MSYPVLGSLAKLTRFLGITKTPISEDRIQSVPSEENDSSEPVDNIFLKDDTSADSPSFSAEDEPAPTEPKRERKSTRNKKNEFICTFKDCRERFDRSRKLSYVISQATSRQRAANLTQRYHMERHYGPYPCLKRECGGRSFYTKIALRGHNRDCHAKHLYLCILCRDGRSKMVTHRRRSNCKQHIQRSHMAINPSEIERLLEEGKQERIDSGEVERLPEADVSAVQRSHKRKLKDDDGANGSRKTQKLKVDGEDLD